MPDFAGTLTGSLAGLRVGVPRHFLENGVDGEIMAAFDASLAVLAASGAAIVDVDLPNARHAIPAYYLVATAEASSNLARYDGVRYGHRAELGPERYHILREAGTER